MLRLTSRQKDSLLNGLTEDMTIDELEQIDDLHIDDKVYYCKTIVEKLEYTSHIHDIVKEINETYQESIEEKPSRLIYTLFSGLISFICLYFLFEKNIFISSAIITVLLIHELGHFIMQRRYSFRNISMGFTPFGAYVYGIPKKNSSSESFWVYIMGPLPGLLIGLFLFFFYFYNPQQTHEPSQFITWFVIFSLIINAFNLFPAGFLDGGRIFSICFDRHPRFSWIMSILLYIPLIYLLGRDVLDSFKDGETLWTVVLLVPLILFVLHFRSLLNNKTSIIKRESAKLSSFLIERYGCIPNKIDYDTACYLFYKQVKMENIVDVGDIWLDRSVPLTNLRRKLYILIYFSLLSISIFMYMSLFAKPQNGYDTYTKYFTGEKYVGEFKDGMYHGQGTFISSDGSKYEGEWKDDKRHGQGIVTLPNGIVFKVVFENGDPIESTVEF